MKTTLIISFACLVTGTCFAQTTYFQQDFSSSTSVASYINSSTPGTDKFNGINGPSGAVSIVNGTLQFDRLTNGTTGHFSHTTDFSPTPTSLYIQMDFEVVSATTTAGNSCLLFYVGNSFSNGVGNPSNAETYARFGIVFTGQGYAFAVRSIPSGGGGSNSATFTGKQTLTFVLNNTGYTVTYLQPGGGTKTLPNDAYDLWVGTTRVFTELAVLTPTQTMTDFKLRIDDDIYAAVFQFDNFLIRDISGALPVSVTDFNAVAAGPHVDLSWQSVQPSTRYTIERSLDAREFVSLGSIQTEVNEQRTYTFTDEAPVAGTSYYRLSQTNSSGVTNLSKVIAVNRPDNVPDFAILSNPAAGTSIAIRARNMPGATYLLTTLTGQHVPHQQRETPDDQVTLLPQHPLPSGVYLLTVTTETTQLTRRVLVH